MWSSSFNAFVPLSSNGRTLDFGSGYLGSNPRRGASFGLMAEWLRDGLQNRLHRFNSGSGLQFAHVAQQDEQQVSTLTDVGSSPTVRTKTSLA